MKITLKFVKTILITGTAMVFSGCSSIVYHPSPEQMIEAKRTWPEANSTYLYKGLDLYRNKCGNCHYLYKPHKYSAGEWKHILPEMKKEAKLTDEEYRNIYIYLMTMSVGTSP